MCVCAQKRPNTETSFIIFVVFLSFFLSVIWIDLFCVCIYFLFHFVSFIFIQDSSVEWSPARVFFDFNFVLFYSEFVFWTQTHFSLFLLHLLHTSSVYSVRQQDPSSQSVSQSANQPTSIDIYLYILFSLLLAVYSITLSCSTNGDTVEI